MVSKAISAGELAPGNVQIVDTSDQTAITVDAGFLFSADFTRLGGDLFLRGPEGEELLLRGYFEQDQAPRLETAEGAQLPAETVGPLAGPEFPVTYAQAGAEAQLGQPIGEVSEINGIARVQHADGTRAELLDGDPIFQGDVVSTGVGSDLGILFVDDTVFSLSSNARMVIDELIYDPQSSANAMGVSLIQGTFVFITGQVAPSGGMDVETPVGTIGIRGTTVGVQITTLGGTTRIVNLVNPETGETGSFVFSNGGGTAQFTQANHFMQVTSANTLPGVPVVASSQVIDNVFGRDLGSAIGIQRQIDRDQQDTPPAPPGNTNDQEGSLPEELPRELMEALLDEVPFETSAGPQEAQGGGAEFRLPPWLNQAFSLLGITPQGVVGEVESPELIFADIRNFFVFFTPESPVAPSAAFGLPGASAGGGTGLIAAIKEDSVDNLAIFAATAGNVDSELTSIILELPGFSPEDLDISNIVADLAGPPPLGSAEVTAVGGVTRIVITFDLTQDTQTFASSFTLDAPEAGSDADLPGIKITANAQDLLDPTKTGSASVSGTLVLDAVLDEAAVASQGSSATVSEAAAAQEIPLDLSLRFIDAGFDASGPDGDGSEAITNVTVALSAGILVLGPGAPAGASITNNGGGSFTLKVADPADYEAAVAALQVEVPAGFDGEVTGTIFVTTAEFAPSGAEAQSGDNSLTFGTDFSVTVTAGAVAPSASFGFPGLVALDAEEARIATILEDSEDNVVGFSAAAGDATDELTSVEITLPGVAPGDIDIAQINADLAGPPFLGSAVVGTPGGVTTIIITFTDAQDVQAFSSFFTLDAPVADSDLDLADIRITASAKDITNPAATGSASASGTVYVDAVADGEDDGLSVSIDVNDSGDPDSEFSPGETGRVTVSATFGDSLDGSEAHTVVVDIPEGFTVTEPLPALAGVSIAVNGDGDVELTLADGTSGFTGYTFEVTASAGVADGQVYEFTATAKAVEEPTDEEFNEGNNEATSQASASIGTGAAGTPTMGLSVPEEDASLKEDTAGTVEISAEATTPGDTLSQVVVTAPEGWVLSATAGGQIAAVEGDGTTTLTLTLVGGVTSFSGLIQATPPADSDIDGSFTVEATAVDGSDSAVNDMDFVVSVDAVADGGANVTTGGYGVSTNGSIVDLALLLGLRDGNPDNPGGDLFNGGGFDDDGSEAVTTVQVTLTGSPAIASDADAGLVFDSGFGGDVAHDDGSLVWTFTGTEAQLETLVASLQLDPADDYGGTITVEIAVTTEEAAPVDGSDDAAGVEADNSDNSVTETFSFDVQAEIFLAGQVAINEIGLGVGASIVKHGDTINTVNTDQNYIELRNVTDHAVSTSAVKSLSIQIVGADGELVIIDLSTATGGSINIPPLGFLTIFEDGTWATSVPGGEVQQTGTYTIPGDYTEPGSVWGFGSDTSEPLGVHVVQDSGSVDMFLANGADDSLFGGSSGSWSGSGSATANAMALLGALIDLESYSGLVGDQDALLAALGRSDIAIDGDPAVDDEGTYIFSRVFADADSAGGSPGDEFTDDTNTSRDWTTSNAPTSFADAINDDDLTATDDFNLQDSADDLNPAQGAGTNEDDAGQTVLYAEVDGDSLQGGRGQDFLFGDAGGNLLLGGDHNDLLFGDSGDDRLEGGSGADFLVDADGADLLIGGSGDDILVSGVAHLPGDVAVASAAGDLLIGDEIAEAGGSFGEDVILGGDGGNLVFGDTLLLDTAFGGSAFDYAVLVFNDVDGPELRAAMDGIGSADWIESGAGNDSVMGQGGADSVFGGTGDDLIFGGDGDDYLDGGAGTDSLYGGDGSDLFVLRASEGTEVLALADLIGDFDITSDSLGLVDGLTASDLTVGTTAGGDAVIMLQSSGAFLAILENVAAADITLSDITTVL